jgi:hypothetical protein
MRGWRRGTRVSLSHVFAVVAFGWTRALCGSESFGNQKSHQETTLPLLRQEERVFMRVFPFCLGHELERCNGDVQRPPWRVMHVAAHSKRNPVAKEDEGFEERMDIKNPSSEKSASDGVQGSGGNA